MAWGEGRLAPKVFAPYEHSRASDRPVLRIETALAVDYSSQHSFARERPAHGSRTVIDRSRFNGSFCRRRSFDAVTPDVDLLIRPGARTIERVLVGMCVRRAALSIASGRT